MERRVFGRTLTTAADFYIEIGSQIPEINKCTIMYVGGEFVCGVCNERVDGREEEGVIMIQQEAIYVWKLIDGTKQAYTGRSPFQSGGSRGEKCRPVVIYKELIKLLIHVQIEQVA